VILPTGKGIHREEVLFIEPFAMEKLPSFVQIFDISFKL